MAVVAQCVMFADDPAAAPSPKVEVKRADCGYMTRYVIGSKPRVPVVPLETASPDRWFVQLVAARHEGAALSKAAAIAPGLVVVPQEVALWEYWIAVFRYSQADRDLAVNDPARFYEQIDRRQRLLRAIETDDPTTRLPRFLDWACEQARAMLLPADAERACLLIDMHRMAQIEWGAGHGEPRMWKSLVSSDAQGRLWSHVSDFLGVFGPEGEKP